MFSRGDCSGAEVVQSAEVVVQRWCRELQLQSCRRGAEGLRFTR
jgi:hypothetical protein